METSTLLVHHLCHIIICSKALQLLLVNFFAKWTNYSSSEPESHENSVVINYNFRNQEPEMVPMVQSERNGVILWSSAGFEDEEELNEALWRPSRPFGCVQGRLAPWFCSNATLPTHRLNR